MASKVLLAVLLAACAFLAGAAVSFCFLQTTMPPSPGTPPAATRASASPSRRKRCTPSTPPSPSPSPRPGLRPAASSTPCPSFTGASCGISPPAPFTSACSSFSPRSRRVRRRRRRRRPAAPPGPPGRPRPPAASASPSRAPRCAASTPSPSPPSP
ncbi:unnamed protein product [Urochloa humidicola]